MSKSINTSITIRLSEDERNILERDANGISMSAYVRCHLFGENVAKRKVRNRAPIKDHRALSQLIALLGRTKIANNINQLAKSAHSVRLVVTPDIKLSLLQASADISEMKKLLMNALGFGR